MSPNLDLILLIFVSIYVFTVSSRPIASDPEHHVTATPLTKTLVFNSSDGRKFEVELQVALQSQKIKQMIADGEFSDEIVLSFPNITGDTMAKVLDYCNKHVYYAGATNNITAMNEMRAFDTQFVNVHYEILFRLFLAANELKMKNLHDLVGGTIGNMIVGKELEPEEIRKMFNVKQGLSCVDRSAKEEYVKDNYWALE